MDFVMPQRRLGVLSPLQIIGSAAYEFYCLAPPGVILEMIPIGVKTFTPEDAERAFAPVYDLVDLLATRNVDLVMQSGVPPALLIGPEAHDRMIATIEDRVNRPATSSIMGVVAATKNVGVRKIVAVNRWTEPMNAVLSAYFAREGIEVVGVVGEVMPAGTIQRMTIAESTELAYQTGKRAFEAHPEADAIYIGGSGWMVQPIAERLEDEFGKVVVGNKNAMVWDTLHRVDFWTPIEGHGRVLAAA
jgi:maleate cis-trans isomerase